jgi:hypothetical protein
VVHNIWRCCCWEIYLLRGSGVGGPEQYSAAAEAQSKMQLTMHIKRRILSKRKTPNLKKRKERTRRGREKWT